MTITVTFGLLAAGLLALPLAAQAQIGAEAQGGKLTTWLAFGFDKELSARWTSVTDLGVGRHSDPSGDLNPVKRAGLLVLTQDFTYRLAPHWRLALAAGYWRRDSYDEAAPYDLSQPNYYRNELRPYLRLHYDAQAGRVALTNTVRTDYRFYFTPGFAGHWGTPFEFRLRDIVNARIPLGHDGRSWLILNDEVLTATDDYRAATAAELGRQWSPYKLTENRASVYYRRRFNSAKHQLNWDVGLMHQYWREAQKTAFTTSYNLMMDFIVR